MLQTSVKIKGFDKKAEATRFACTTYRKLLVDIREHLRLGDLSNESELLKKMSWTDSITPLVNKYKKEYRKRFSTTTEPTLRHFRPDLIIFL